MVKPHYANTLRAIHESCDASSTSCAIDVLSPAPPIGQDPPLPSPPCTPELVRSALPRSRRSAKRSPTRPIGGPLQQARTSPSSFTWRTRGCPQRRQPLHHLQPSATCGVGVTRSASAGRDGGCSAPDAIQTGTRQLPVGSETGPPFPGSQRESKSNRWTPRAARVVYRLPPGSSSGESSARCDTDIPDRATPSSHASRASSSTSLEATTTRVEGIARTPASHRSVRGSGSSAWRTAAHAASSLASGGLGLPHRASQNPLRLRPALDLDRRVPERRDRVDVVGVPGAPGSRHGVAGHFQAMAAPLLVERSSGQHHEDVVGVDRDLQRADELQRGVEVLRSLPGEAADHAHGRSESRRPRVPHGSGQRVQVGALALEARIVRGLRVLDLSGCPEDVGDGRLEPERDPDEPGPPHEPQQRGIHPVGPGLAIEGHLQAARNDPLADGLRPSRSEGERVVADGDRPRPTQRGGRDHPQGGEVLQHPVHAVMVHPSSRDGGEAAVGAVLVATARRQVPDLRGGDEPRLVGRGDVVQAGEVPGGEGGDVPGTGATQAIGAPQDQVRNRVEELGDPRQGLLASDDGIGDRDNRSLAGTAQAGIRSQEIERLLGGEGRAGTAGQDHAPGQAGAHDRRHGTAGVAVALVHREADQSRPQLQEIARERRGRHVPLREVLP